MAAKVKSSNMLAKVGVWSFIVGVVIALLVGLFQKIANEWTTSLLILLGLVVGFLNVTDKETTRYLLAAVSLVIVATFGQQLLSNVAMVGPYLTGIFSAMVTFIIPATLVVALKSIYSVAQDE